MNIRSVTLFAEPALEPAKAAAFFSDARIGFHTAVQTTRIALTPFPSWWNLSHFVALQARQTAEHWSSAEADYISLGPVKLGHDAGWLNQLPEIIASSEILFAGVEIADSRGMVDLGRCHAMAGIIRRVSTLKPNGFANLYLGALANCPPGSPFFPVAYHRGGSAHFALAVEAADLAMSSITVASTLSEARTNLVTAIEYEAALLTAAAEELSLAHDIAFSGIDFSLAPAPGAEKSLAGAIEALGRGRMGAPGTLFTAAFIADAIGRARFLRCGFSGLMLPVLEDSVLAARAGDGHVTVNDLLTYSAVCGVGLDTVPLPGDIGQDTLAGILLDIAAMATRLNKPLTARLMPIPGLEAGDPVQFDFPYFEDGRVMSVTEPGLGGHLRGPGRTSLQPISNNRP